MKAELKELKKPLLSETLFSVINRRISEQAAYP